MPTKPSNYTCFLCTGAHVGPPFWEKQLLPSGTMVRACAEIKDMDAEQIRVAIDAFVTRRKASRQ